MNNRIIFEKNVDTFRKSQEQINRTIQEISNNAIELQKNVFDTYQSSYTQFWDNIKIITHTGKISIYHKDILKHLIH